MQALKAAPDELTAQRIDRFAGPKRTLKLCTLALAIVLITRLIWGHVTARRVGSRLADYRSRGEPAQLSDLARPAIPDDQNAAFYILRAAKMLTPPNPPDAAVYWLQPGDPLPPENERIARAWISANEQALAVLKIGLSCGHAVWQIDLIDRRRIFEGTNAVRSLQMLLFTASTIDLRDGDHERCLDHLDEAIRAHRTLRSQPLFGAQASCSSLYLSFADQIAQVLKSLRLEGEGPQDVNAAAIPSGRAAHREQLRRLIRLFLDEGPDQTAILQSLRAERVYMDEWTTAIGAGEAWKYHYSELEGTPTPWLERAGLWWIAPYFKAYAAREMDYDTVIIKQAQAPSSAALNLKLLAPPRPTVDRLTGVYPTDRVELFLGHSDFRRLPPMLFKASSARRQAAVWIAARLYRADHGTAPTTVHQLIPNYLDRIPDDPIAGGAGTWSLSPTPATSSPSTAPSPTSQPSTKQK